MAHEWHILASSIPGQSNAQLKGPKLWSKMQGKALDGHQTD
jgi:hypothetical protein